MKKLLKSRKALSPVVAAIILIAVTVAVSIAVAAWMGALTFTFMKTESIEWPTSAEFEGISGAADNYVNVTIRNTGSVKLYLNVAKINGVEKTTTVPVTPIPIEPDASQEIRISSVVWNEGYSYEIRFIATSGTEFAKTFTAS